MTLPNFLIIGAQKSGTSWLSTVLDQHPDIFLPKNTELHYFTGKRNGEIQWYESQFANVNGEAAIGEKSTSYLWTTRHPDIAKRIWDYQPKTKLIAVLRNPVYRTISAFGHCWRLGKIPFYYSIDDLLQDEQNALVQQYGLIDISLYYRHLKPFFDVFGKDQIEVLIYEEDVVQHPVSTLEKVCQFLGVKANFEFRDLEKRKNFFRSSYAAVAASYYFPQMRKLIEVADKSFYQATNWGPFKHANKPSQVIASENSIQKLYHLYEEENKKLFDLLGRTIEAWQS